MILYPYIIKWSQEDEFSSNEEIGSNEHFITPMGNVYIVTTSYTL